MTTASPFGAFVPGFDFLQGLVKNAGAALPNVGQWVAPTLDPAELEKRINELRTVQFWLEQNARMIGTTIQAMEVQRMTLSTLKSMNVSAKDLREAMTLKMPSVAAAPAPTPAPAPATASAPAASTTAANPAAPMPGVVDPMAWWGALTQQFTEIASSAMKDGRAEAARETMGAMMKQSLDAAGETFKQAVAMPAAVAQQAAEVANAAVQASVSAKRTRKSAASAAPTADAAADAASDTQPPAAEEAPAAKPRRTTRKTSD
ncbi:MAG: hypothetical protein RLZZ494_1221 [Pseudomonadota bacterium]